MTQDTPQAYTKVAIRMHWILAILLVLNIAIAFYMESFNKNNPQRDNVLFYHASFGLLIFGLAVFRFYWRTTHRPPALPDSIPKAQRIAAHSLHWIFYFLMLAQPVIGYVHRLAGGHPVSFFGLFDLPMLIGKNEPLRLLTDTLHDVFGILFAVLIVGHILAALKHRFIDKDAVLQQMISSN